MSASGSPSGHERALLLSALESPEDISCRLVYADWLEEHGDRRGEWLRITCLQQEAISAGDTRRAAALATKANSERSNVPPDWAALLDGGNHFTILLTTEIVNWLRDSGAQGKPLDELQAEIHFADVKPGDHIYPVQVDKGRINVLTRLRVAGIRERKKRFTDDEFLSRRVRELMDSFDPSFLKIIKSADGSPVQFGRALPLPVVERLRFQSKRAVRGLSSLKNGLLKNTTTIQGVFKLTPPSARDFGLLMYAPELLREGP